jgi:hypothetical protein
LAIGLPDEAKSVLISRFGVYIIPLQIFVGSRLANTQLFGIPLAGWIQLLIAFQLAVLLVGLLFAGNSFAWLLYRNLLLHF